MSSFSRSSKRSHYRNGNNGSNYYQKKGIFGNLLNMLGSRSGVRGQQNQYPLQNTQQPLQNQQPLQQNTTVCGKCTAKIPNGSKFCLECGEKVNSALFCLNCGESLPPNAKFCLKCGTKLNG